MNHPDRLRALLIEAAATLADAQAHANAHNRQDWGRPLDGIRWALEDYAASIDPAPGDDDGDTPHPFGRGAA